MRIHFVAVICRDISKTPAVTRLAKVEVGCCCSEVQIDSLDAAKAQIGVLGLENFSTDDSRCNILLGLL